jgi:xylan 1,4-beta-xylosidase
MALLLAIGTTGVAGRVPPTDQAGVPPDTHYRNLFAEQLGKSEGELDARLSIWWQQLFYGDDASQRVYFPTADGMAYVADVANADARTEGLSYGMMIAVQLDHRAEFDRIWTFAKRRLYHESGPYKGYFAWHADFNGRPLSEGPAPDGEQWFAMALFFASHRWGNGEGIFNYEEQAQEILRSMLHKHEAPDRGNATDMFDSASHLPVFAPDGAAAKFSDPSYLLPAFYELWARWARDPGDRAFFAEAARAARVSWRRTADPRTGLMPDYATFGGAPVARGYHAEFASDAWRTLGNPAVDWSWWHADPWEPAEANRVLGFLGPFGGASPNKFQIDGTPASSVTSPGLYAMAAVAGLAADPGIARPFVKRLWEMPVPDGKYRYYDGMLGLLAMLEAGGRFRIYGPPEVDAKAGPVAVFDGFRYSGDDTRFEPPISEGEMRNPIIAGFHPDPSLCRNGDDYYLVNSSFTYFPGIPVYHSRDLEHWTQVGHVITRPSQANFDGLEVSRGVFAPDISFHDGTYYLVTTLVDCGGNCYFTAKNPAGDWSDPVRLDFDGIDPSFFWDDDGSAWLVNNGPPIGSPLYNGHRAIWLQRFDPGLRRLVGPRTVIVNGGTDITRQPIWIEGPHLFKRDGWYYLICAEGGTAENHSEVVLRSQTLAGPWRPGPANPILTQRDLPAGRPEPVTCTGHADFVSLPNGKTWAVFLGCRPYEDGYYNTGRETFALPVSWHDGWPEMLAQGTAVPESVLGPLPAQSYSGKDPTTGNFTWRDDFSGPSLALQWNFLRTSSESWWSLSTVPGSLSLRPRNVSLGSLHNPSFMGRRQQHARFTAIADLRFPATEGFSAGLAAFQNENHNFFLGVRRKGADGEVFLEEMEGGERNAPPLVVASAPLHIADKVDLEIEGKGGRFMFRYRSDDETWRELGGEVDGRILSTKEAGGFVGTYLGMYARLETGAEQ